MSWWFVCQLINSSLKSNIMALHGDTSEHKVFLLFLLILHVREVKQAL